MYASPYSFFKICCNARPTLAKILFSGVAGIEEEFAEPEWTFVVRSTTAGIESGLIFLKSAHHNDVDSRKML